jgi:hypothetical protein
MFSPCYGVLGVDRTQDELNVVNFPWCAKSLSDTFKTVSPNNCGTQEQGWVTSRPGRTPQRHPTRALRCCKNLTNMLESRVPDGCKQE